MTLPTLDRNILDAIEPGDAVAYLESRGWQQHAEVRRMLLWRRSGDEELEVLVPQDRQLVDFVDRVRNQYSR